ncbi:MAG: MogA/MoaB family molybdenum cofactor biosynthesis protein [Anaerolineaceae bacterium]|nr:MogA/MoaB family molybdenum cofactor biosynthesis protein [Anaerolineaceae bacterium]
MINFAVLTISDRSSCGIRTDLSGPALISEINKSGWKVINSAIVPDDYVTIKTTLEDWCNQENTNVILTTGGTGFSRRDNTPEATAAVIERCAPGIAEAMRSASLAITPHAMLSRAIAGIRERTLIINLPGSPKAAIENFLIVAPVLQHAVDLLLDDPAAEEGH